MEANIYSEMTEKLGKLERNEEQMSPRQREQFAAHLNALRKKILDMAREIASEYVFGGIRLKQGQDAEDCVQKILALTRSDAARAEYNAATDVLFRTYSLEKFLEALLPSHYRVRYEGYAPYWCKHCTPYTGKTPDGTELTYWNDIIDMGWNEESRLWYRQDGKSISYSLPPTMEQVTANYRKDLQRWAESVAPALRIPRAVQQ